MLSGPPALYGWAGAHIVKIAYLEIIQYSFNKEQEDHVHEVHNNSSQSKTFHLISPNFAKQNIFLRSCPCLSNPCLSIPCLTSSLFLSFHFLDIFHETLTTDSTQSLLGEVKTSKIMNLQKFKQQNKGCNFDFVCLKFGF